VSDKTPVVNDPLLSTLNEIRGELRRIHLRMDGREDLVAAVEELRISIARLEAKFDLQARERGQDAARMAAFEKRVAFIEGEIDDLKDLAKMLRESHQKLELYRREETRPFGKVPTDGG